jgi:hypothetical protein
MLKAFVVVCVVQSYAEQCLLFEDDWGPYTTEENCMIRVNQMGRELFENMSPVFVITSMEGARIPEEGQLS